LGCNAVRTECSVDPIWELCSWHSCHSCPKLGDGVGRYGPGFDQSLDEGHLGRQLSLAEAIPKESGQLRAVFQ
jgi:hypothetical protein